MFLLFDTITTEIYTVPIDRHARRFLICLGMVSSRWTDAHMAIVAEGWFEQSEWINVNYISAGIAQIFSLLKRDPEISRVQKDLITIAGRYGYAEDMMNFLQMY